MRGIARGGMGTRVGPVVSKATEEKAEAYGAGSRIWNAGPDGLLPDRDIQAHAYDRDGREDLGLLRGRYDHVFDEFRAAGSVRSLTTGILWWADWDERPSFSGAAEKAGVASLKPLADNCPDEIPHIAEDRLHRNALRAVVSGHPEAQAIATAALESRQVEFTRYYSRETHDGHRERIFLTVPAVDHRARSGSGICPQSG